MSKDARRTTKKLQWLGMWLIFTACLINKIYEYNDPTLSADIGVWWWIGAAWCGFVAVGVPISYLNGGIDEEIAHEESPRQIDNE